VTEQIRSPIVTDSIRRIADIAEIRTALSDQQRRIAAGDNIVTEGRDQGTEVFPEAECKLFLTASPLERAKRRHQQLVELGRPIPLQDILTTQERRDEHDRQRPLGSLRPSEDAITINSDGMTAEDVLQEMLNAVHQVIESRQLNISTAPRAS